MNHIIKEFKDYIHQNDDMVVEMARINDKKSFPFDVFVYGGNSYGSGRNEHGEPHFHFSDNIKNPDKINISIKIPTKKEWKSNKELTIIEDSKKQYNWEGRKKIKSIITTWLDENNCDLKTITNLDMIILQWNILNKDNENIKQVETE